MEDCIFCQIVEGKMSSDILYEDSEVVAFKDINPRAPVHILIVPREHIASVLEAGENQATLLGKLIITAKKLAKTLAVDKDGFRLVINTGPYSGQAVQHIHLHLLGGRRLGWPPG
jgi:histidine triad (HIT) family protein